MTWPMLIGVFSLMSFQLVDSAFISQLGIAPLAVQGFTLPMHLVIIGLQVGLGIATTAVISKTLGAGQQERAQQLGGLVIISGATIIMLLSSLLWLLKGPILKALGATADLMPLVNNYWIPWLISAWLGAMLYFGYSISRSHGNTMLPGVIMVVTSLLNIALDPLFIFTLGFGLPGAALATIASFTIGCLVVYPRLYSNHWLTFSLGNLPLKPALQELGNIMGPAMLSQLMPPISAMLATKLIAGFGISAVGAWALGSRIEFFSIVVVLALTMSMPPMIGRLLGSGQIEQIKRLVNIAIKFVILWQLAIAILLMLIAAPIASLLSNEIAVANIVETFLLRIPISSGALGVCIIVVSVCNALGLPMRALLISCLRLFVCFLPFLWIGAQIADMDGLLTGAMIGNFAAGLVAWILYHQGLKPLLNDDLDNTAVS